MHTSKLKILALVIPTSIAIVICILYFAKYNTSTIVNESELINTTDESNVSQNILTVSARSTTPTDKTKETHTIRTKYGKITFNAPESWNGYFENESSEETYYSVTKNHEFRISFSSYYASDSTINFYESIPENPVDKGMPDPLEKPPVRNFFSVDNTNSLKSISLDSLTLFRFTPNSILDYGNYMFPIKEPQAHLLFYSPVEDKYTYELPIFGHQGDWNKFKITYFLLYSLKIDEELKKEKSEYIESYFKEADEIVSTLTYVPNE